MNHGHVEPDDAFSVIHLGSAVIVMRELMVRFEMAVDDGVRVRNVGLVSMQRCQTRPEGQEGDRERHHRAPSNPPKHSPHYVGVVRTASMQGMIQHAAFFGRLDADETTTSR